MKNLITNNKALLTAAAMLLSLSGCASVAMDSTHKMSISAVQNGQPVTALCDLKSDKGEWSVNAPGELDVARSAADLLISCVSDDGTFAGTSRVESHANSGMYGNLLVAGWAGMIVDHHTGKGFSYPDSVVVELAQKMMPPVVFSK